MQCPKEQIKIEFTMQQIVENGTEFPPKRSFFTQGNRRIHMTGNGKRIDQIHDRIAKLENTLVYCCSELLG